MYKNEENFRESLNFKLCLKIFMLMKNNYNFKEIKTYKNILEKEKKDEDASSKDNLNNNMENKNFQDAKSDFENYLKIFNFLEKIVVKIGIKNEKNKEQTYFYIRPWITFYLIKKTKNIFLDTVKRDSTYSKLDSLIDTSDYFIFEMICQANIQNKTVIIEGKETHLENKFDINKFFFEDSKFQWVEIFYFLIVIIHQIMLIAHFYRNQQTSDVTEDINAKEATMTEIFWDNIGLSIFQCFYLLFFIFIWFKYEFPLIYQKKLITFQNRKIIFKNADKEKEIPLQNIKTIFKNKNMSLMKISNLINEGIKEDKQKFNKLKALTYATILNGEVNVLIISLIFVFLYLVIRSPIILVLLTLLIINLYSTLNDIVLAVNLRWKQLLTVLLFTYLIIYIFAWISLLWITSLYTATDGLYPDGSSPENFCTSSIQCILFFIDYGIRSGGGIGDVLPKISYKNAPEFFIGKFLYTLVFHILIIFILGNIFLGIIVDTFATLRDKTHLKLEDKESKCYICQLTKDISVKKNINFKTHVKYDHDMWNYVYFLTDLHLTNENQFDELQRSVWNRLIQNDISWIPIEKKEEEEWMKTFLIKF